VFSEFYDELATVERNAQLTRCFSAVAELLVYDVGNDILNSYKHVSIKNF